MVAETTPAKKPRKVPAFGPGNPIPLPVKLTIRSMYVLQGLQPAQIAPLIHLTPLQVANMVRREGWSKLRGEKRVQKEQSAISRQDARADEEISRIHEAAAIRSEECMVKTADHCAEILNRTMEDGVTPAIDSKSLQMASGSLRNFVMAARTLRGMDQRNGGASQDGAGNTTNLIFVGALAEAPRKAEPKQAESVTEVQATPIPPALPA
jgi:hypothetical protein